MHAPTTFHRSITEDVATLTNARWWFWVVAYAIAAMTGTPAGMAVITAILIFALLGSGLA